MRSSRMSQEGTSQAGASDENGSPLCARPLSHDCAGYLSTLGARKPRATKSIQNNELQNQKPTRSAGLYCFDTIVFTKLCHSGMLM